jgi:hypothetical protein
MLRSWWVCLVLAASSVLAGPKKPVKSTPPPKVVSEVEVKLVLDEAQARIGACVLETADDGPLAQVVRVGVSLNGKGEVLGLSVSLEPEGAKAARTRACIEDVVKGLEFPKTGGPRVSAEREWTFRAK